MLFPTPPAMVANPEVGAILLSLPPPIALELEFVPMLLIKPPAMVAYAELAAMLLSQPPPIAL